MLFQVAVSLLLSFAISLSCGQKCCETIRIKLENEDLTEQSITVGVYKANDNHKLLDTTKIIYNKENSPLRIYYSPDIPSIDEQYRKRWLLAVPGQFVRIRNSEPDSSVHCPSKAKPGVAVLEGGKA